MRKLEVYLFCKNLWEELIERDGEYLYEKHDEEVLTRASQKFNVTKEQVDEVFQELSTMEAKITVSGMSQVEIKEELKKILSDRFEK